MKAHRKQRLFIVLFIVAGVAIAVSLALFALSENINLFYNPTQIAAGEVPAGQRIRAGGMVVDGSVKRDQQTLEVLFEITDYHAKIPVKYTGILPDLFREGQGVVALGRINEEGIFVAEEVLAKHDENYMPPEVAEALQKAEASGKAHFKPTAADGAVSSQEPAVVSQEP